MTISVADFIIKNIITLNLLIGLSIIIYANRRQKIPATKIVIQLVITFVIILAVEYLESWAASFPNPTTFRLLMTAAVYILRPMLLLWEVYLLIHDRLRRIIYSIPEAVNIVVTGLALVQPGKWVFGYDRNNVLWREPLAYAHYIVSIIYLILIIYQVVLYYKRKKNTKMNMVLFYMFFSTLFVCIMDYLNILEGGINEIIASEMLFIYVFLCSVYQRNMHETLLLREQELNRNRLALMQSQIKPHFIYNSLTTIQSLCSDEEAIRAISEFAGYLRGIVDIITETECIPVSKELKTVGNYLALVKRRFGDKLVMDINIEDESFLLPAFSIQILVENAIKHGIRKTPRGKGTLLVHVYTYMGMHIVDVTDDGIGYDVGRGTDDEENHIGLVNLNERLDIMCGGRLSAVSCPGVGTTMSIRIPV